MIHILASTFFLFSSILLGFIFGKLKIFQPENSPILTRYVFYLSLPAGLFLGCYKSNNLNLNLNYLSAYFFSQIVVILSYFLINKTYLKAKKETYFLNVMTITQVDAAYFTIPLLILLYGTETSIIPLMFIQNVIFFTFLVFFIDLSTTNHKNENIKFTSFLVTKLNHVLFKNPIILSSILGYVFSFLHFEVPPIILQFFHFFAVSSSPVALFALGLSFAASYKAAWGNRDEKKSIIVLTIGKVFLLPIIAWIVGTLLSVPKILLHPLVIMCASPAATHSFIIAQQYKFNAKIQTNVIVLSTILSLFTISLMLSLLF